MKYLQILNCQEDQSMLSTLLKMLLGAVIGGVLGFLYYKKVGCPTGACPITKNPYRSTIYGAFLGIMVAAS
jgi:hypothetical protein